MKNIKDYSPEEIEQCLIKAGFIIQGFSVEYYRELLTIAIREGDATPLEELHTTA